jgi:hypothetical protein
VAEEMIIEPTWRRLCPGVYKTLDNRFVIREKKKGKWCLTDNEKRGVFRTDTLEDAKARALWIVNHSGDYFVSKREELVAEIVCDNCGLKITTRIPENNAPPGRTQLASVDPIKYIENLWCMGCKSKHELPPSGKWRLICSEIVLSLSDYPFSCEWNTK